MTSAFETADDIASFIEQTELWVNDIISPLGWSKEHIVQSEEKYPCEHDKNHYVPKQDVEKHKEICKLRGEGYSRQDLEKDTSSDYFYEKSTTVVPVKLEEQVLRSLLNPLFNFSEGKHNEVPRTMDRYFKVVSPAQRLQVYEYCLQSAKATERLESKSEQELMLLSETVKKAESNKPKSRLELLIEERNQKRRRTSYKKVHSGKKSHLEVIREVIANQMEILQELEEGHDDNGKENETEDEYNRQEAGEMSSRRDNHSRQKKSRSRSAETQNRRLRGRSRERSRSMEKYYRRSRSRSKEKYSGRHRRKSRDRSRDRYRRRSRGKSRERSRDRNKKSRRSRSRSVSKSHKKKSNKRKDRSRSKDRHEHKKKSKLKVKEELD